MLFESSSGNSILEFSTHYSQKFKLTMLIEKLPLPIPIHAYVRIQPNHLPTPNSHRILNALNHILQPRLRPEPFCKRRVFDLEAVIDTDCVAFLRDPRRGGKREGFEEGDVFGAEGGGPEV